MHRRHACAFYLSTGIGRWNKPRMGTNQGNPFPKKTHILEKQGTNRTFRLKYTRKPGYGDGRFPYIKCPPWQGHIRTSYDQAYDAQQSQREG